MSKSSYLYDTPDEARRVNVNREKTRYESYRLGVTVTISEIRKFFENAVVYNDLCMPFLNVQYANSHLECGIFDNVDEGMYTIANPLSWPDIARSHLLKVQGLDYSQRDSWTDVEWHKTYNAYCDPMFIKVREASDQALDNIRSIRRMYTNTENAYNIVFGVEYTMRYIYDYSIFAFTWLYAAHRDYRTECVEERWDLIENYAKSYECWRNVKRHASCMANKQWVQIGTIKSE